MEKPTPAWLRIADRCICAYLVAFFAFFPLSGVFRGGALPKLMVGSAIGLAVVDLVIRAAAPRIGIGEMLLVAFGFWYVLSVAASPYPELAGRNMVTVLGWPFALLGLAQMLSRGRRTTSALVGYVLGCAVAGAWGLLNVASGAVSTVQIEGQDVNDLGFYTATGATIAIGIATARGVRGWLRLVTWAASPVLVLAVLASLSRGSTLGLGLGLLVIFVANGASRLPMLKGLALAFVAMVVATPVWLPRFQDSLKMKNHVAGENVSSRLDAWGIGINLGVDHPIAGVGPTTIAPYILERDKLPPGAFVVQVAHNTIVEALYGTGIVGMLLLGAGVLVAFVEATKGSRRAQGSFRAGARPGAPVLAALAAGMVCSMFTTQLFNATIWLVLGLAFAGAATPVPVRLWTRERPGPALSPGTNA